MPRNAPTIELPVRGRPPRGPLRRRRRRRRRRRLPNISVMPTLITLGNLIAGFAAIHYATKPASFQGPWGWSGLTFAGALVFFGMVLDAMDGAVARRTRSVSPLGGYLDSLADVVTFGVAPAFMTIQIVALHVGAETVPLIGPDADDVLGKVLWAVAAVYVCCAALRLARFNAEIEPDRVEHGTRFRGLPSPGAAGVIASLILLHQHLMATFGEDIPAAFARGAALGIPIIMLLVAFAMVSSIPYAHVANRFVYAKRSFAYVAGAVVLIVLVLPNFQWALAIFFTAYALWGPLRFWWLARRLRARKPTPA